MPNGGQPTIGPDESLMLRFQRDSDAAAFAQLVSAYAARGLAVARQIVSNRPEAEDAVQEALLRVVRSRNRYDPARPFSVWFYAILRNVCLDILRRRGRESQVMRHLAGQAELLDGPPADPPEADRLLACLSPIERQAVSLRIVHDLSLADVAAALGISVEAAKKRVQRGLRRLRERVTAKREAESRRS